MNLFKYYLKKNASYLIVGSCILLGIFFRFHHIGLRSFWLDEADSANILKYDFINLWHQTIITANNAAYIYIIKIWSILFDNSEIALRSFSALCGLLSIIAIYKLGSYLFNKNVGYWSAFLITINYFSVFYSIQSRQYSLVILFSILSYYYFTKLLKESNRYNALLYIICTTIGIYLHPWFILILGSQTTWIFLKRYFYNKNLLAYQAISLFLSLPWIITLLNMSKNGANTWIGSVNLTAFWQTLNYFTFGSFSLYIIISIIIFVSLLFDKKHSAGNIQLKFKQKPFRKINENNFLVLNYLFFPIIIAWIISQLIPFYEVGRYEAVVLPPFILIIASFWSNLKNKKLISIFCLLLIIFSFKPILNEAKTIKSYLTNDKKIAQELIKNISNNDFIIFTDLSRPPFDYYLERLNTENKKFTKISFPNEMETHPAYKNIDKMTNRKEEIIQETNNLIDRINTLKPKNIWVIYNFNNPINDILLNELNNEFNNTELIDVTRSGAPFHFHAILIYELKKN